jgi:hypothetical protein
MKLRLLLLTFLGFVMLHLPASGDDGTDSRLSLKGIRGVEVVIVDLPEGAIKLGLTKEIIQADVELKLRLAGMGVLTPIEGAGHPGRPFLYVFTTATDSAGAANVSVSLVQRVNLSRDRAVEIPAETWSLLAVIPNPSAQGIQSIVEDSVDMFISAWLSVNPK